MLSKDYDYKTVGDGQAVGATVYWDKSDEAGPRAIALAFHGGAYVVGTRFMLSPLHVADLVAAGFVVVSADYSLCPQVSLYQGPEQDAKDAYMWCKSILPPLIAAEGVTVDPARVVALGYSAGATLALCLGAEMDPPAAIVDFYGAKYFRDGFWSAPLPAMAHIPDFDKSFLDKIYEEPLRTTTASSLERTATTAAPTPAAASPAPPRTGPPKIDLSVPRNAWLFNALKQGTHLELIVQDGDLDRVDPTAFFSKGFPPTFFIHGTADDWVLPRFSEAAHQKLRELGVETGLALVPDLAHGFDMALSREDARYGHVTEAFAFLTRHV